jgi:hypothetical protein
MAESPLQFDVTPLPWEKQRPSNERARPLMATRLPVLLALTALLGCTSTADKDPDSSIQGSGPYDPDRAIAACLDLRQKSCEAVETCAGKDAAAIAKCLADQDKSDGTCEKLVQGDVCTAKSGSAIEACATRVAKETCTEICGKPSNGFQFCFAGTCAFTCFKYTTSRAP